MTNETVGGPGRRPSSVTARRKPPRQRPLGVDELARRFSDGRCFWTGKKLKGTDGTHWHRLEFRKPEDTDDLEIEEMEDADFAALRASKT